MLLPQLRQTFLRRNHIAAADWWHSLVRTPVLAMDTKTVKITINMITLYELSSTVLLVHVIMWHRRCVDLHGLPLDQHIIFKDQHIIFILCSLMHRINTDHSPQCLRELVSLTSDVLIKSVHLNGNCTEPLNNFRLNSGSLTSNLFIFLWMVDSNVSADSWKHACFDIAAQVWRWYSMYIFTYLLTDVKWDNVWQGRKIKSSTHVALWWFTLFHDKGIASKKPNVQLN